MTNINLNILNYLGWTSLHYASESGHQSVVELLLDRGANKDQKDISGEFISSFFLCIYHTINLPFHKYIYFSLYLMVCVSIYLLMCYLFIFLSMIK